MSEDTLKENCNCPMECEFISYSSYYVSSPFDPDELCSKQPGGLMENFYDNRHPPQFVRNLKKFTKNVTSDEYEICKKNAKFRSEVTFQLATNTMSVTVISRRLSFFDKLSGFGKDFVLNLPFIFIYSRRYFGSLHWYQYSQYGGGCFLDIKIFNKSQTSFSEDKMKNKTF